jgi:hypothetical protein
LSTEPRPIKVVNTAPSENIRANEIAIETAKTGEVTAAVTVMSNLCKKCNSGSAYSGDKKLSLQKANMSISQRKIHKDREAFLRIQGEAGYQRN